MDLSGESIGVFGVSDKPCKASLQLADLHSVGLDKRVEPFALVLEESFAGDDRLSIGLERDRLLCLEEYLVGF